jgi:hypothetical protein
MASFLKRKAKNGSQNALQQLQQAPVIDLIIRYDGRTGQVALMAIGGNLEFTGAYQLLDMARRVIRTQELAAVKANGNGQAALPADKPAEAAHPEGVELVDSSDNKG